MKYKKAQASLPGMSSLAEIILVTAIAFTIIVIILTFTDFGRQVFQKIMDTIPFF